MLIDSHCHLNYKGLIEDQQNVLERARGNGVDLMLNIATRESEWDDVLGTAVREALASGGVEIEEVAKTNPDAVKKIAIDPGSGVDEDKARAIVEEIARG